MGERKKEKKKKSKAGDVLLSLVLVFAVGIFCYAAYNLYHIYTEYKKGTDEYNQIQQMAVTERDPDSTEQAGPENTLEPPINVDFASLRSVNEDVWAGFTLKPWTGSAILWSMEQTMRNTFILHMRGTIISRERFSWIMKTAEISATAIL